MWENHLKAVDDREKVGQSVIVWFVRAVCHCLVCSGSLCHCLVCSGSLCHCLVCSGSLCHCLVCSGSLCRCLVCSLCVCRVWDNHLKAVDCGGKARQCLSLFSLFLVWLQSVGEPPEGGRLRRGGGTMAVHFPAGAGSPTAVVRPLHAASGPHPETQALGKRRPSG